MPTIKIVPMPGVSVPGPQGPRGYQGDTGLAGPAGADGEPGAGFEAVPVANSHIAPDDIGVVYSLNCDTLPAAWTDGMSVRLTATSSINGDPISGKYVDGIIQEILPDRYNMVFVSTNSGGDWAIGDYDSWSMTLTGASGSDANTGDIDFLGNNITAHGDMTIGVDVVPGTINLSAYAGVNVQTHQDFGLYVNGIEPDNKVVTTGDLATISLFPEPSDWTPVLSSAGFAQSSNPATGHYYKYGRMTVVNLNVPFTNVTNFGTGQYSLTLPFAAATHMDIFGGTLHDTSTNSYYTIKGHVEANSNVMTLWYLSVVTKDAELDHNSPFEIDTTDLFHMNFIYETVA